MFPYRDYYRLDASRIRISKNIAGTTLESGIDVGQGITVGPGNFVIKNKRRA